MFKHHQSNDRQVRYQRNATRLYILFIMISLTIFAVYIFMTRTIHHETIVNPTESEYIQLLLTYQNSLSCPCSSIFMNYSSFINIQPHYHQVCSSDFISSQWFEYLLVPENELFGNFDYRVNGVSHFQLLNVFCQESQQTIDDARRIFLQTQFVSSAIIAQNLFEDQMNLLIQTWQSDTVQRFLRTIQFVQATIQGNQLTNGLTNVFADTYMPTREMSFNPMSYSNCSCALSGSCRISMGIYEKNGTSNEYSIEVYTIPNFFVGCFPVEALLASTLECFYNRSCMTRIDEYMKLPLGKSFNFTALSASRNRLSETIESIVSRLMLDSWSSNVSFSSYYNRCASMSCTFEFTGRNKLYFVIASIVGVFGGLSFAYEIFFFIILRFIEKMVNGFSCRAVMNAIKNTFRCRDEQQMSSRLHFILVAVTLCILYIFYTFSPRLVIKIIEKPLLSDYRNLLTYFPNTLQCSCSHISIKYKSFLTIIPRFHEVCSSEFVSDSWLLYLYGEGRLIYRFTPVDFQASAIGQFQLLASLCQISQKTVNDSLSQLVTSDFINVLPLPANVLDERIRATVNEFKISTSNLFLSTLALIREMTGVNMLISAFAINWVFTVPPVINHLWTAHTIPLIYNGCNCGLSSKCVQTSEGMLAGCYPLEALLQTTLQCLYDQECIDSNNTFKAMNISSSPKSRFHLKTTIESIVNQLMVEEYSTDISYEKYFTECAPSSCTYSYTAKNNIIEGITTLIGLYGGLVIICAVLVDIIVKLFRRQTRRVGPGTN